MRTCSTHYRVISSVHPLNGGLGGYCRGKLPQIPCAASYSPKLLDMTDFLQQHTAEGPYTPYQEVTLPLQAEEMGPPT
jgi:hypothetical protein